MSILAARSNSLVRAARLGALAAFPLFLAACQADYAADIHNQTPQPLYAQIMAKSNDGKSAALAASRRLGPGDRALVGPIRTNKNAGAYLVLDTMPNPTRPLTYDLQPGTAFLSVKQDSLSNDAPMRVEEKR